MLMYLPIPQRVVSLVLLGLWLWCLFLRIACSHFDVSKVIVTTDTIGLPHYANSKQLYQVNCKTIKQITKLAYRPLAIVQYIAATVFGAE